MQQIARKLFNWASILEPNTREQAEKTASMPFIWPHLALMPDAHLGRGATVGSVVPTLGAIMPACVGVDIGCGMMAVRTQLTRGDLAGKSLRLLREWIEAAIPLSAGKYNDAITGEWMTGTRIAALEALDGADSAERIAPNWRLQLGSLGSGNHFIEVSLDEQDRVWLFLHSGSRGVGNKLATRHIKIAQEQCERRWISLPDPDLAYLVEGEPEFWAYLRDLRWAQEFARLNREEMMDRVIARFREWADVVDVAETIQCFAGETPVMTRNGCAPISALAGGTHELLTAGGEWVKAPVEPFGEQEVMEVTLSRSGVLKTIRATPAHRWLLRTRRGHEVEAVTSDLKPGDRLQFSFPKRPNTRYVDTEAACRGFVYGDGSRSKHSAWADFHDDKDKHMLPLFAGHRTPRTYPDRKRITGLPLEWKLERPPLDSPPSVLYGWLAGYFAADGDVGKTGRPTLASANRDNLEYVRLAAQEVGIGTFGIRKRMRLGHGKEISAIYLLGLMRGDLDADFFLNPDHRARFEAGRDAAERRGWNVVSVRATGWVEEVYCAVVDGTHSFALEDNILTGNCHHNYTEQMTGSLLDQWKRPKGRSGHVWLSRKGAIDASEGRPGLIPGSMGTRSYVVTGKGNRLSLNSSPHGAGREHSRAAARRTFTRAQLDAAMEGIEWGRSDAFLDEIPGAYKDVEVVMADAADLVEIRHTLRQIVNVKGD